ncbi:MAG: endonuclease III [Oscillospiraceae bacterium]|jgi:endonuclease-3|nr:endonuclease III [Oscillospiraceae bacterium]
MTKKEKIKLLIYELAQLYPNPVCALFYSKPHELLVAARLSAQCTDKRVNLVTPALFARFQSLEDFADAKVCEVEEYVRSCGLYKTKARDIAGACKILRDDYSGIIPDSIDELLKLPGIGRKTANLLTGTLYGKPAVVTDTHVIRLSNRLGLAHTKDPAKTETILRKLLPEDESLNFCHRLVFFGREVCKAQNPKCGNCGLKDLCVYHCNTPL